MTAPGAYDHAAGLARIAAAQARKNDRVHNAKTVNRRRNKTARKTRRANQRRGH